MADLKEMTLSNEFADYIFQYSTTTDQAASLGEEYGYQRINRKYFLFHLNNQRYPVDTLIHIGYSSIPKLFTITSTVSLEETGVFQVRNNPNLALDGRGILIGFMDTGINYRHPAFLDEYGHTRILRIWDQTIQSGQPPEDFVYGTEYTREEIDAALASEKPLELIPTIDTNGHGTSLAGAAAGRVDAAASFSGIAPNAYIAMVKLKEAKAYLKEYFLITGDSPAYQESDIMLAVKYLINLSISQDLPLVICIGLGSNQGSHDGNSPLDQMLATARSYQSLSIVSAGGNETGRAHHFYGEIHNPETFQEVEIQIGNDSQGFSMELWGLPPEIYSVGFVSPLGETIERIPARMGQNQTIRFILEPTVLRVAYELTEISTGEQLIFLRFTNPTPGIWRMRVYCKNYINGRYHVWLPITGLSRPDIIFLTPNPFTTITIPGNGSGVITPATYDAYTGALYPGSGRGYTPMGDVKPDIAAPGVNVTVPDLRDGYASSTGSSVSAAITAGCCALILQWGSMRTPRRNYYPGEIKTFLIRGAIRDSSVIYPNRQWGYGILNVYNVFTTFLNP